ncbi:uncharacterized protein MCYG_06537 [Microsporum canis CBS 113480]|uniref:Uncharacterized protein n=1 Tax=Arthroderma otae (strain ATCC MYA-4605 / CBS 113480) TaxID=554155 RepID=C5FUY4_ARTOC|nr:uncharacterized protein MCYG_06537 [Microsporum canis CBS 113480]EEQ33718.1 predicted protein [Microsporum canis CBS 113480]
MATEIKRQRDPISGCLFGLKLDECDFQSLGKQVATLSAQVAVCYTLQTTISHPREQASDQLPSAAGRLSKFFEVLYRPQDSPNTAHLSTWQRLNDLTARHYKDGADRV